MAAITVSPNEVELDARTLEKTKTTALQEITEGSYGEIKRRLH